MQTVVPSQEAQPRSRLIIKGFLKRFPTMATPAKISGLRLAWLAGLVSLEAAILLSAQQPQFRSAVDVVRVSAVVLGADKVPVRNLTAKDFTVLEDGRPRPIVGFEAVDLSITHDASLGSATWVRDAPRDVTTNKLEDRWLFLILIDDAIIPTDLRAIERAKAVARDVVSRLGAFDHTAVMFTRLTAKAQPFTTDHALLLRAIDATTAGLVGMGRGPSALGLSVAGGDLQYHAGSAATLRAAAEALEAAPQPRKTLVYVGPGVDFNPLGLIGPMSTLGSGGMGSEKDARIKLDLDGLFAAAARSNVSVYAFDVDDTVGDTSLEEIQRASLGKGSPDGFSREKKLARDYLRTIANNTGGRAVIGSEDVAMGVAQMFSENSSYYLLGFTPATATPGRHKVEIRTSLPGAAILSPNAFEVVQPSKVSKAAMPPLSRAMASLLPHDNLPLRVTTTVVPSPDAREGVVAIVLGVNQPASATQEPERMRAEIRAYTLDGTFAGGTNLDVRLLLRPTLSGRAQYDLLAKVQLKPGRYQLRIAAEAPRVDLHGSVFTDVDVPDFYRDDLRVAPLLLAVTPTPPVAPANAFAGLFPAVPTSHRTFAATDGVAIVARISQNPRRAPRPVSVTTQVRDTQDRVVLNRTETLAPPRDASSASPVPPSPTAGAVGGAFPPPRSPPSLATSSPSLHYQVSLPLGTLSIGDYLVVVTATIGEATSERSLRLSRR